MAILITIVTLTVLSAATIQFYRNVSNNYQHSYVYQEQLQLSEAAKFGIDIAKFFLLRKSTDTSADTFFSEWHSVNEAEYDELFPHITLNIAIVDGESKLPVNFLANIGGTPEDQKKAELYRESLHRILISDDFGLESDESRALVDAISDWIDSNDTSFEDGAEDDYYQSLESPHLTRNKPIQELSDLLPVKGMTEELLFGSQERTGLNHYLTANNPTGLLNINRAHPDVLKYVFPQLTNILIENIVEFRENPDNAADLDSPEWYKKITNWPQDITLAKHILTVSSSGFEITAEARTESRSFRITAGATRGNDGDLQIENRRIKE